MRDATAACSSSVDASLMVGTNTGELPAFALGSTERLAMWRAHRSGVELLQCAYASANLLSVGPGGTEGKVWQREAVIARAGKPPATVALLGSGWDVDVDWRAPLVAWM